MNEAEERDYEWFEALQALETERLRKMGIEAATTGYQFETTARPVFNALPGAPVGIDWGLLDEFTLRSLWILRHEPCQGAVQIMTEHVSVADLVLAVEEHMEGVWEVTLDELRAIFAGNGHNPAAVLTVRFEPEERATVIALIDSHQALLAVLEVCKPPTGWPDTEQWTAQREAALAAADALTRGDAP